jgi:hypothetical protein
VLAAGVGAETRECGEGTCNRTRRYDAALGVDNQRRERLGCTVDTLDVDVIDERLVFDRRIDNLSAATNASVVNEGVEAGAFFLDQFDNRVISPCYSRWP